MALICLVSAVVPFLGNLAWAALFARARRWLADPVAMRRTHVGAGVALVAVGVAIAVGWPTRPCTRPLSQRPPVHQSPGVRRDGVCQAFHFARFATSTTSAPHLPARSRRRRALRARYRRACATRPPDRRAADCKPAVQPLASRPLSRGSALAKSRFAPSRKRANLNGKRRIDSLSVRPERHPRERPQRVSRRRVRAAPRRPLGTPPRWCQAPALRAKASRVRASGSTSQRRATALALAEQGEAVARARSGTRRRVEGESCQRPGIRSCIAGALRAPLRSEAAVDARHRRVRAGDPEVAGCAWRIAWDDGDSRRGLVGRSRSTFARAGRAADLVEGSGHPVLCGKLPGEALSVPWRTDSATRGVRQRSGPSARGGPSAGRAGPAARAGRRGGRWRGRGPGRW